MAAVLVIYTLIPGMAVAQKATLTLDTAAIRIGEQVRLQLGFTAPKTVSVQWPFLPDTLSQAIEVVKRGGIDTTFTRESDTLPSNARIDDAYINAKTDYSTILYQASVFNLHCRVFAPRYRQAHIQNFYSSDTSKSKAAFEQAYNDIKTAFEYYLAHYNQGRPIIIAGHSQGAFLSERLLKEFFENKPLQKQLVAAYIIGWPWIDHLVSGLRPATVALFGLGFPALS